MSCLLSTIPPRCSAYCLHWNIAVLFVERLINFFAHSLWFGSNYDCLVSALHIFFSFFFLFSYSLDVAVHYFDFLSADPSGHLTDQR